MKSNYAADGETFLNNNKRRTNMFANKIDLSFLDTPTTEEVHDVENEDLFQDTGFTLPLTHLNEVNINF